MLLATIPHLQLTGVFADSVLHYRLRPARRIAALLLALDNLPIVLAAMLGVSPARSPHGFVDTVLTCESLHVTKTNHRVRLRRHFRIRISLFQFWRDY
jgi:hypothetical protein